MRPQLDQGEDLQAGRRDTAEPPNLRRPGQAHGHHPLGGTAAARQRDRGRERGRTCGAQGLSGLAGRAAGRADRLDASRGFRVRGRNELDHPQPCPFRGLHRRPELLQRESPWVEYDGVNSGVLHPSEVRGTGERSRVRADFNAPEARLFGAGAAGVDARMRSCRPECDDQHRGERAERAPNP